MKTALHINRPGNNSFILWEHLLLSAVAFIGTFALLFFGPLLLGSKRRSSDPKDSLAYHIIRFIIEHPEVHVGLSVLAVVIINFYLFRKNQHVKHLVKIDYDDHTMHFELTNLYFTKKKLLVIPAKEVEFYIEHSHKEHREKRQKIIFRHKQEKKTLGEIHTKHFIYSENLVHLKKMIGELEEYRIPN